MTKTNRLIHSTSPYLLQHAHNPVDWQEWGLEALAQAKKEDKPILVSIGYSACHWCHVMERECFEKEDIAAVMNDAFICIKVDREERPDVDQLYMDAVQAMGENGGWPLNVFLTPDQKPFFGGTYFPPQSWTQLIQNARSAFDTHRKEVDETAKNIHDHLVANAGIHIVDSENVGSLSDHDKIFQKLASSFDKTWGGMQKAPKFIMPSVWQYLLRYHFVTKNYDALEHILFTLDKISMGGIHDWAGGGFARYSVDNKWFAPHFEKMLYDNAQLMSLYSEAYAVTKNPEYKKVVYSMFEWLQRDLTHAEGGFYSALDADSEGVEGKYYVWSDAEFREMAGGDADLLAEYFSISLEGNWEEENILFQTIPTEQFARSKNILVADLETKLSALKSKLLERRSSRIMPGLDDKIIYSWNAMMVSGLTDAYRHFSDPVFLDAALKGMAFLEKNLSNGTQLFRSWKGKASAVGGFLDDYAAGIHAMMSLYEVTLDSTWIEKAKKLMDHTIQHFSDPSDGFFFYTAESENSLVVRKKEFFDNVIPASNSIMAQNLFRVGTFFEMNDWQDRAKKMIRRLYAAVQSDPNYTSYWAMTAMEVQRGADEVVIIGSEAKKINSDLNSYFLPFTRFMGSSDALPLTFGKTEVGGKSTIYVCRERVCKLPVQTVVEALKELKINN